MTQINQTEAQQIAGFILLCFKQVSQKYDFEKYPKCEYDRFKLKFSALNPANQDIHDALVWKYGHWGKQKGKKKIPPAHSNVISEVQGLWPQFIKTGNHHSPHDTFKWWKNKIKRPKNRYITITVAFITHLIHHNWEIPNSAIPIIDRHNFRAMNTLIAMVRKNHSYKINPSSWEDILDLKNFMCALLPHLNNVDVSALDRFLMMWGKSVSKTFKKYMSSGIITKIVSVKLLTQEMEEVFAEGTERAITPVHKKIKQIQKDINDKEKRLERDIDALMSSIDAPSLNVQI